MTRQLPRALLLRLLLSGAVLAPSLRADSRGDLDSAIQATKDELEAAQNTAKETKEKLEKALETYKTIKDYVSGAAGTELIDRLYQSRGIEDHTKITELRGKLQEVVRALDRAGIEGKLEHASKILGQFEDISAEASNALQFMDRFNPEGARGDPTRGLRIIGATIEDAAGSLPWPMDEIFKEYAQTTATFSKKLDELQQSINQNTRQGSLGGSYASYADAQAYFEQNFEDREGRTSTTYLDVSYAFPLLGRSVQVFQDADGQSGEYYVFSLDDGRGTLVPRAFETAYRYFAALPDQTVIAPGSRLGVLIARANNSDNLNEQIAEAQRLRALFEVAYREQEALLRDQGLWDTLGVLLLYGADAFVGFYLLDPEKHAQIIRIRDALANPASAKPEQDPKEEDDKQEQEEESKRFVVLLGAPKTELDPGERITVTATLKNGQAPFQFQWTLDGLPMPGLSAPTLPVAFGKLGTHNVGVVVKDGAVPMAETAGNIDLFVGKMNDRDLVGRWSGTVTTLEFEQDLENFNPQLGQAAPMILWIAPDGSGGLKLQSTGSGFVCHPDAKAVRSGASLAVHWDGPSQLPQNSYLTSHIKCAFELQLAQGRLTGTAENISTATMSAPGNAPTISRARVKTSMDLHKISDSPGPPPGQGGAPGATPAPSAAPAQ